jgi:hypothetical protein
MMKRLLALLYSALFLLVCGLPLTTEATAQNRKAVSAAEVNGTFRSYFKGRFKDSYNEIKILALGKGKLKISFELIYPHLTGAGELSANLGTAQGVGEIYGDTGVFTSEESGGACKIIIKFVRPGEIKVEQSVEESDCGFGHNVTANGTYKKVSAAKPKFEER